MSQIAYTVTSTLPDEATAREYVAWLKEGHIDAVIARGAESAMIVRLEPSPPSPSAPPAPSLIQVEVRYIFATRDLYDRYVAVHAPALRAEGIQRFGPDRGILFSRRTGTIV